MTDLPLYAPFFVSSARVAGEWREQIVTSQLQKPRMKTDGIAHALQHRRFHVVVQYLPCDALKGLERFDMPANDGGHPLVQAE